MEEAEYCDHVAILDHGQVLARGTPAEIRSHAPVEVGHDPTMEDAFIAIVEAGRGIGVGSMAEASAAAL
jgi:ABC-type multidrug transport system ATPase subunit